MAVLLFRCSSPSEDSKEQFVSLRLWPYTTALGEYTSAIMLLYEDS